MINRGLVTINSLNVRQGPGTTFPVVKTLNTGNEVMISQESNGWLKIGAGNEWVSAKYVKKGWIVPVGFTMINDGGSAVLFRKEYPAPGQPDFVVVADIRQTKITSILGAITDPRLNQGPLGGSDALVTRASLANLWTKGVSEQGPLFSLANGQFFDPSLLNTILAFTVKQARLVIDGHQLLVEYPGLIRLLRINNVTHQADIIPFNKQTFKTDIASFDTVIAGLDRTANKGIRSAVGRTFVGVSNQGFFFLYSTAAATQAEAAKAVSAFGADNQLMLDGGGSQQLMVQNKMYVQGQRTIPHAVAIKVL